MFLKLLRYDLRSGLSQNRYKYCLAALAVLILCLSFFTQTQDVWISDGSGNLARFAGKVSICDYFIYLSKGMEVYHPSSGEPFRFPIFWAGIQVIIALLVATYPSSDLHTYARNVFLRAGSKKVWWCAKIFWTILTGLSFYLLGFFVVSGYALLVGDTALFPVSDVSLHVNGIDACAISPPDIVLALIVGVLASVLLEVAQVALSFVIKPVFSFVAIMAYLIAATFLHAPILMADYSMLLRNGSLFGGGLSSISMALICVAATLAFAVGGGVYFKKRDII